ncbi:Helicase associated domain protein [Streptomyces sp. PA03-2a]|uniref:Helicase associated domain protein n=1 Tax=Streptomyces sp. PA03-2a TaxID=3028701 RepID=UPI0029B84440|nr:Helicase associated domain protein [Streptomyces sp. PA03-2a]MDX2733454.1 Helicase associated domain protein [Streptomyces sp. PA03-2a]
MTADSRTFGKQIAFLGLAEAIEGGVLAGFEIDVLEIRDPDPVLVLSEEALRGRRLALLQTALLEHAAAHDIHTTMVFHNRVEEAQAFAATLHETAAELYQAEVSDAARLEAADLPASTARPYELEPFRHVRPERVWTSWLCGEHTVAERRAVLRQFANGINAAGKRVHRAFLCSVRVLGEGVDISGLRGVEAICFADPRASWVEVQQNIGRALRPNPDGTTKVARIIVPVFLGKDEDPENMVASASYAPLAAVLQAVRSHDEQIVDGLASRALTRPSEGTGPGRLVRDEEGNIVEGAEASAGHSSAVVNFSSPRDPALIAAFVRTRVIRPQSMVWLEGYNALHQWRRAHGHTGPVAVPYDTEVALEVSQFPLGRWVAQQRRTFRAGELEPWRIEQLDELGMVWEPGDEAWERKIAALRSYRKAHGHLAPRQDAQWFDEPIGRLLANLRSKDGLGKDPERAARRAGQLHAIDPEWDCAWPLDWQRHYRVLADLADADGTLPAIEPGVTFDGDDLGRWITRQARDWPELSGPQRERLAALGITAAPRPVPAPQAAATTGRGGGLSAAFRRNLAALAQYLGREGHIPIPRQHAEHIVIDGQEHTVALGVWWSNTRSRRDKLNPQQRAALQALGIDWA